MVRKTVDTRGSDCMQSLQQGSDNYAQHSHTTILNSTMLSTHTLSFCSKVFK